MYLFSRSNCPIIGAVPKIFGNQKEYFMNKGCTEAMINVCYRQFENVNRSVQWFSAVFIDWNQSKSMHIARCLRHSRGYWAVTLHHTHYITEVGFYLQNNVKDWKFVVLAHLFQIKKNNNENAEENIPNIFQDADIYVRYENEITSLVIEWITVHWYLIKASYRQFRNAT